MSSALQNAGEFIWEVAKIVILALAIVLPIRYFLFQPFVIQGSSMEPNFYEADYLIVDELSYRFSRTGKGGGGGFQISAGRFQAFYQKDYRFAGGNGGNQWRTSDHHRRRKNVGRWMRPIFPPGQKRRICRRQPCRPASILCWGITGLILPIRRIGENCRKETSSAGWKSAFGRQTASRGFRRPATNGFVAKLATNL